MKREVNMRMNHSDKAEKRTVKDITNLSISHMQDDDKIITDPLGSWTGVPTDDALDPPVQDVDDL